MASIVENARRIANQMTNQKIGFSAANDLQWMQLFEQLMEKNKNKKLAKDQNIMAGLMGNLGTANSDVHFQNLDSLIQNTTVQPENQLAFETFKNMFTDRREAYNLGKEVYNDIAPTIGSPMEEDKYYLTEEKLMNFDFGYDKNGNRVKPEIGDNTIDYLKKELEKVSSDIMKLENGKSFKYGKVDNVQLINKLKKYQGTLTKVMQARFGGLTSQEANVILWQDNYDEVRNTKLRNINSAINTAKRNEVKWQSQMNNLMKSVQDGDENAFMIFAANASQDPQLKDFVPSGLNLNPQGQTIVTDDIAKLQNQLGALIENEQLNQINLIKERKAWQVYDETDTREAGSFGDEANTLPEGWTPYQEELFQQGYGTDESGLVTSNEFAPSQPVGGGEVAGGGELVIEDNENTNIQTTSNQISGVSNKMQSLQDEINSMISSAEEEGYTVEDLERGSGVSYEKEDGTVGNAYIDKLNELEKLQSSIIANDDFPSYLNELDEDGYIDVEAIADYISQNRNEVVTGVGVGGAAVYNLAKTKPVVNATKNYLTLVGGLDDIDIGQIFGDARIQKNIETLSDLDDLVKGTKNWPKDFKVNAFGYEIDNKSARKDYLKAQRKGIKELAEILNEKGIKFKGKEVDWTKESNYKHLNRLLKSKNKWNLFKLKASMGGLSQIFKTGGDFLKVAAKTGLTIGPFEGAILGWYAGDKLELGTTGKLTTAGIGYQTMKSITKKVMEKGGWLQAMKNPVLQSKIGKFLIRKAPGTAMKLGLKGGTGALLSGTGLGTAFGLGMLAWTANDIKNLVKKFPQIKQWLSEYAEGKYDEGEPIIAQGPRVIERQAQRDEDRNIRVSNRKISEENRKISEEKESPSKYLSLFQSEAGMPSLEKYLNAGGPDDRENRLTLYKIHKNKVLKNEHKKLIQEFKNKYNLSDKAIQILEKLSTIKSQKSKDRLEKTFIKELKELGLLK